MSTILRRMTKQKSAILEYLKSSTHHPSAEEIYLDLKILHPELSRSTVYRNLSQLAEDKLIERMGLQSECDRYDGNRSPHNHFICTGCGKIYDCGKESISVTEAEKFGDIDSFTVYFYGICRECKE